MKLGLIPPSSNHAHRGARIWAAGGLALLAAMMWLLLVTAPPRLRAAQIAVFETNVGACRLALAEAGFETTALPDLRESGRCGYSDAVELTLSTHPYSQPVATRCAMAAALALWERDVVAPAAEQHLGQSVARIELAGPSYQCRSIAGRRDGRMSEHAHANAIDIGGFTLADGSVLSVAEGWRGEPREQAFLRAVRDGGCQHFNAVLSPDYNRAHRDHFHFDLGGDQICD